jgi:AcrR family transcriptional regulator
LDHHVELDDGKSGTPRGRPRDPERERRVLVAAIEEYSERGWAGLTMDGVAKRAGVGKSTIYLRWTNKEDLIAAAVQSMSVGMTSMDTGTLRGDLTALARTLHEMYATTVGWGMVRILIDAAGSGDAVSELREINEKHRGQAYAILERGVQRGELRAGAPQQLTINALYGTFTIYRMMHPWDQMEGLAPDPDELVENVVDFLMTGLKPWVIDGGDA